MTLDQHIEECRLLFEGNLWDGYNNRFLGRTYRVAEKRENKIQPHLYLGNNEYKCVYYDDNYDSTIIFDVESDSEIIDGSSFSTCSVNIIVALNLGKIYGNNTISDEQAHSDVLAVLKQTDFEANSLIRGIEGYNDYDLTDQQRIRYNRQPIYVFKIQTNLTYKLVDCKQIKLN